MILKIGYQLQWGEEITVLQRKFSTQYRNYVENIIHMYWGSKS